MAGSICCEPNTRRTRSCVTKWSARFSDLSAFRGRRPHLQRCVIWIADAHHGDGKRFIVHADEKLTSSLELERVTHESSRFPKCRITRHKLESRTRISPA